MRDKHSSKKILISIAALVVAIVGTTTLVMATKEPARVATGRPPAAVQPATVPTTYVTYKGADNKTALELLKSQATVTTRQSSFGEYVESIEGVKGGDNGKFWTFYVNGQQAQVGAGAYETRDEDTIEWKFE